MVRSAEGLATECSNVHATGALLVTMCWGHLQCGELLCDDMAVRIAAELGL